MMRFSRSVGQPVSLGPPPPPPPPSPDSDIRLKTDIERIGTTDKGLPLYTFIYKAGGAPQVGVMAQDVLKAFPGAVVHREDGYLAVDYAMLGLDALTKYNTDCAAAEMPLGPPPPPPPPSPVSDIRLKTDVAPVGVTDTGLPLYSFRYKSGGALQIGVMAQDVIDVAPDAVSVDEDGYFRVDYDRLGLASLASSNAMRIT